MGIRLVHRGQQLRLQLRHGEVRGQRPHQAEDPRDVRGGHRRARQRAVRRARQRAQDRDARGGQVHRGRAVVRERRQRVVGVRGGHRDDVREVERARIRGARVRVGSGVARGRDEGHLVRAGVRDRVVESLREPATAPRVARQVHAHLDRVVHRGGGVGGGARPVRAQELETQDLDVPVHAHRADAVVPDRPDGAGGVRAVAVVVKGIAVVVVEVVAVDVVHEAVAVVVDAVPRDLAEVRPDVGREIGMVVVATRVDHADEHIRAADRYVPRERGVDVGTRRPPGLPRVPQGPHLVEAGVVGDHAGRQHVVRLGVLDLGVRLQARDRLLGVDPGSEAPVLGFRPERAVKLARDVRPGRGLVATLRLRLELDDQLTGHIGGRWPVGFRSAHQRPDVAGEEGQESQPEQSQTES